MYDSLLLLLPNQRFPRRSQQVRRAHLHHARAGLPEAERKEEVVGRILRPGRTIGSPGRRFHRPRYNVEGNSPHRQGGWRPQSLLLLGVSAGEDQICIYKKPIIASYFCLLLPKKRYNLVLLLRRLLMVLLFLDGQDGRQGTPYTITRIFSVKRP